MDELIQVKKSSRRSAWLTIYGALVVISSLVYSYINLSSLEADIDYKKNELETLKIETNVLASKAKAVEGQLAILKDEITDLQNTQDSVLDFLVAVTDGSQVHILDSAVDWDITKSRLTLLPSGDRKSALLNAILLAWKDIPFEMGKQGVYGFDSPRFLNYVLQSVGIKIEKKSSQRMSDALMDSFIQTTDPKPGDLVFFKGQTGSFGFILLTIGDADDEHVGVGTLQKSAPLQIISMGNINSPYFPLKGYYRVKYPDE
jgi:hypothetical protein